MAEITVRIVGMDAFRRLLEFAYEYAWHKRECAAIDADGDWRTGYPPCDCGYDEDLAAVTAEPENSHSESA